jgi:hypothetical protein
MIPALSLDLSPIDSVACGLADRAWGMIGHTWPCWFHGELEVCGFGLLLVITSGMH